MKKLILLFFCLIWFVQANAQLQDSTLTAKELKKMEKRIKRDSWTPSPKKALLLGLVIPGGGQIHNRRWWKLPFAYAAYTGIILAIDYNSGFYVQFRDAFIAENNNEVHEFTDILSATSIRSFRNKFDKQLQLSYIGLVLAHGLISMEAFVDAHLKTFEVDDDLSFHIQPNVQIHPVTGESIFMLSTIVKF